MKKFISLMLVVLMLGVVFAGCGSPAAPAGADAETAAGAVDLLENNTDETAATADTGNAESSGNAVTDSYTKYIEAKSVLIGKLMDGLGNNPDTSMAAFSFMGIAMVELVMLPVSLFGSGQEAVAMGLSFMGAEGVQYTENGNSYSVTYKDEEGITYVYNGTYDAATDSLVSTATKDGAEYLYSEHRKTSFGYVGQFYSNNEDGTTNLYQFAIEGEDGTIGMSMTETSAPAALTGSEAADFPTACSEWYAVHGTTITGMTSDGTALDFEYTPTPSE